MSPIPLYSMDEVVFLKAGFESKKKIDIFAGYRDSNHVLFDLLLLDLSDAILRSFCRRRKWKALMLHSCYTKY